VLLGSCISCFLLDCPKSTEAAFQSSDNPTDQAHVPSVRKQSQG
jgi:hypothetical protein